MRQPASILDANIDSLIETTKEIDMNPISITSSPLTDSAPVCQSASSQEKLIASIHGAIDELNEIMEELYEQAQLNKKTKNINSMIYYSLLMLIDELKYIMEYIQKIENQIDISVFEVAKKLNETIVNLIGHRKDILFKVIETSYKIHDYIIKWKKMVNDTLKLGEFEEDIDFLEQIRSADEE